MWSLPTCGSTRKACGFAAKTRRGRQPVGVARNALRSALVQDIGHVGNSRVRQRRARILAGVWHEKFGECEILISVSDKRRVSVNGEETKFSDFIGKFPALAMGNEDIRLLRGSPENRRKDADMFVSSLDAEYFAALKTYHAALAHRNALLRGGETDESAYLPFEIQMAEAAEK